jgi:biopolymer transport protein ExbB
MIGFGHGRLRMFLVGTAVFSLLTSRSSLVLAQQLSVGLEANRPSVSAASVVEPGVGPDATVSPSVLSVWRRGGPILVPIMACSFLLFLFVFERAICLRRARVIPRPFVKRFIHQLQEEELKQVEALQLCRDNRSPVAEVFAAAVKKWGRPSVDVEQAVLDAGERVANQLRRYLRLFHGISTISPLLGLLGTVLGMINSFNTVAASGAMGRPELLAAGISEALITTASGLCVAIPAIIAHLYFVSRVDRLIMEIDALGQQVINAIASDGWCEKAEKKPAKAVRPRAA